MMKTVGLIYEFISKNSGAALVVVVILLINSSFRQCQTTSELKQQIAGLQQQKAEILTLYSKLADEQRKIAADVEKKLLEIDDKYKDKQQELIDNIKTLKDEYLVDETRVLEFLVKFDIVGGTK